MFKQFDNFLFGEVSTNSFFGTPSEGFEEAIPLVQLILNLRKLHLHFILLNVA